MHIKDGICYADQKEENIKVINCKPLEGMMLLITFSNGEKKLFDCTKLEGAAFKPLQNENIFKELNVNHGFVTWDNGNIDISPEKLYEDSLTYETF